MELSLIDVRWHWDAVKGEWILIATEPAPRGEKGEFVSHWMKDDEQAERKDEEGE